MIALALFYVAIKDGEPVFQACLDAANAVDAISYLAGYGISFLQWQPPKEPTQ